MMKKIDSLGEELKEKDRLREKEQMANVRRIWELEKAQEDLEFENRQKENKINELSSQNNKLMEENIKNTGKVKELEGYINNLKIE